MKLADLPKTTLDSLDVIMDSFDGGLVVDAKGRIVVMSDSYAAQLGFTREEVEGKHVLEVLPTSRMMEVIETGKPIYADLWELGNESTFVTRVPLIFNGNVIGAVALCVFRYWDEARRFISRTRALSRELDYYKRQVNKLSGARYSFANIIGHSETIEAAKENALKMARTRAPVLIMGETGTGKELFAHAIHQESMRSDKPFIRVNCAGINESLSDSELFGYEDGAFTGARKGGKPGKFELANGGTIFLDEVNELPLTVQAKLLRVLQEGEIDRVGSTEINYVNVRVISATNADIDKLVENRTFREDLLYRLNSFIIQVPPLRDRSEDIPILCQHFVESCNDELDTFVEGINDQTMERFLQYQWPGNIRELKNVIHRACLAAGCGLIAPCHLPPETVRKMGGVESQMSPDLQDHLDQAEKEYILRTLNQVQWNRVKAAEILSIHRSSLYVKMKKHGLLDNEPVPLVKEQ